MYNRHIAIIDLTKRAVTTETLPEEVIREYIGGILLNQFLYEKYSNTEPVIIGTGPLTGTLTPASSVSVVTAKSPLSNKVSHVPLMWHIGAEIKYSGFDFIIITGRAEKSCYLWFHDEIAEICDGVKLKDLNVKQTVDGLRKELGDENIQVITTGEAGRKGSPISMLSENYWGSKDTLGFGGIFGEKKLISCAFRGLGTFSTDDTLSKECFMLRKKYDSMDSPQPNILKLLMAIKASESLISLIVQHLHRNDACFNCGFNCYGYVKFREDPKIIKSTSLESPGIMLVSPLSLILFYQKTGDKFFELLDEAQSLGIEPGWASLIGMNKIESNDDLKKIINESVTDKNNVNEKILNSLKNINPRIASIYKNGIIPLSLALNNSSDLNEWCRTICSALISGICPVFLQTKREINTEIIESLLKKITGFENLNLTQKIEMFVEKYLGEIKDVE